MADIQRIHIETKQLQLISETYTNETKKELLTVLGGNEDAVQGLVAPTEQVQKEGSVSFDPREISKASDMLADTGHDISNIGLLHNHNRMSGHGFGFSDEDLLTARTMYDTTGIDRMGLLMNGYQDDDVHVQHMIIGNRDGELHDLEGEEGRGKVLTIVTDITGNQEELYSDSIAEAEAKEFEIMMLKEKLFEEEEEIKMAA